MHVHYLFFRVLYLFVFTIDNGSANLKREQAGLDSVTLGTVIEPKTFEVSRSPEEEKSMNYTGKVT